MDFVKSSALPHRPVLDEMAAPGLLIPRSQVRSLHGPSPNPAAQGLARVDAVATVGSNVGTYVHGHRPAHRVTICLAGGVRDTKPRAYGRRRRTGSGAELLPAGRPPRPIPPRRFAFCR